jgi:pilus assembly protein CpaB
VAEALRNSFVILMALAFGIIAATWSLFSAKADQEDLKPIVVAVEDILPGVPITASQLRTAPWPLKLVPAGTFEKTELVVGRVARQSITTNEPILDARLASRDAKGGLSSLIAPGKRAISVRVDEVIGVAGFALPGSFVDVMVSARDASSAPFSKIVLSRVKVVASEQDTTGDPSQPKVVRAVTLELSPGNAEKLDLARNIGSLSLVLRNEVDTSETVSSGVRLNDILPGAGNITSAQPSPSAPQSVLSIAAHGSGAAPALGVPSTRIDRTYNSYGAEEIRGASSLADRKQ